MRYLPLERDLQAVRDNPDTNQRYTLESYKVYSAATATSGFQEVVEMRPCTVVATDTIDDNIVMSKKLEWIKESNIPGFRRGSELFNEYSNNAEQTGGLVEAY
ncbi:MAG: hypothetical protein M1813_000684 [Trichoglossum hirsutum]|nr:MAG: hypothetical protein M1813_000684 [Trichoglossum hirsutum]